MPSIDELLTSLEADLSDARGHALRLEDVIGGKDIEIGRLRDVIRQLAPHHPILNEGNRRRGINPPTIMQRIKGRR